MKELYDAIFKRKSMRKYDGTLTLTTEELEGIVQKTRTIIPLYEKIKVKFALVPRKETTAKWGEYCLLMYSEKDPNYLLNAGYMLQQMDLYCASLNIGSCWYGLAKVKEHQVAGLEYVIMLALGKSSAHDFRTGISEFNRKDMGKIWQGDFSPKVKEAVRVAPSACNTQPWRIEEKGSLVMVYQNTQLKSFIPKSKRAYFNTIDLGIALCHLEIAFLHEGYCFDRLLSSATGADSQGLWEIATYQVKKA
ncbi:MAG: nitroreductase family protein [Sphaerochaetaceae bacterium]